MMLRVNSRVVSGSRNAAVADSGTYVMLCYCCFVVKTFQIGETVNIYQILLLLLL